jgi:hypothetical protein
MSSLVFHTDQLQAFVATDTLATSNGEPFMFTTKAFVVPHLNMIMCGTGMGGFLGRWFITVNDRMIVKDIDNLDYHAPRSLSLLWRSYVDEFAVPDNLTTTVYHFGFSVETGAIHSYAYRSANNFVSERLPYGLGVKPECQSPEDYELPAGLKDLMEQQRVTQQSRAKEERIYIGGKIIVHHLTQLGCQVYVLDQFADYATHERAIYENFSVVSNDP